MSKQVIGIGSAANDGTGDPVRTAFSKANSNFTELYNSKANPARYFDVVAYGAVFDGATNIAVGVQAAIDAARTYIGGGNYRSAEIVFPQGGAIGRLTSTLNFTGFTDTSARVAVRWNGIGVLAAISGAPVIDALGSTNIVWDSVHVSGSGTTSPNVGIQIGRINTTALDSGGHGMMFVNCRFVDSFTLAALYNFSGESCSYVDCIFQNNKASASAYALILDGINHFSVTSAFVTQNAPANTAQSFNQNLFIGCDLNGNSSMPAVIWKSGCRQHEFQSCYILATSTYAFLEYCIAGIGGVSHANKYDIHIEGNGATPTGYFLIDGTLASPAFGGFELKVAYIFANRVFKTQGSVTSASIRRLNLNMAGEIYSSYSGTFQVFDNAGIWTVDGVVDVVSASYWNLTSSQKIIVNSVPYITCDMA